VPSVLKLAILCLGLVSMLVVAADAADRKFIREGKVVEVDRQVSR